MLKNFVRSAVNYVKNLDKKENVQEKQADYLIFRTLTDMGDIHDFVPVIPNLVRGRVIVPDNLRNLVGYHFRVHLKGGFCRDYVIYSTDQADALGAFKNNLSLLFEKGRFEVLTVQGTPIRSVPEPFASKVRRAFDKEAYLL